MNLRNLFRKKKPADALESQSKDQFAKSGTVEPVKSQQHSALEEIGIEESTPVYAFLDKLKAFCRSCALEHTGGFGGSCDACSTKISQDNFYSLGGRARCENCMDRVLYKHTNWYYHLANLESWGGSTIPHDLILEGANIRDALDKRRRAALGNTTLDLTGSAWDYRKSDGEKGFFRFEANGSLRYKKSDDMERGGTWRQDGSAIYMEMNDRFCEYNGTTTGTQIAGEAHNVKGMSWTWHAHRSWPL
jgi:hypothetical protein